MLTSRLITTDAELAVLEQPWNELAGGEPLRSWDWLATWWKHYGKLGDRRLHVVAVFDDEQLIGVAPWYVDRSFAKGSVIRWLGDGHVCTDHPTLVCRHEDAERVAGAIADSLDSNEDWDRLEFEAIDDGDSAIGQLVERLESHECLVSRHRAGNTWIVDLPKTWDEYNKVLSQSHRRQLKKCRKDAIESGRSALHQVTDRSELDAAWRILVDLHQRRRNSLGQPGCFASPEFAAFHREVAERLLAKGQLRLSWIEFDGTPFTAEYHFAGPETVYTYQSGMDTDRLSDSPGRLAYMRTVERAIADGYRHLDFMRGDEKYKAHFRAVARPQYDYRVFPNRRLARLRGQLTCAGLSLKRWVKQGVASVLS
jgi:CelD/BcsL family acetyltransferase involved in cellulose biosynthesis